MSVLLKSAFADDEKSMDFIDWQSYEMKFVFDLGYDEKWSFLLSKKSNSAVLFSLYLPPRNNDRGL
jgi:hypothetical protein